MRKVLHPKPPRKRRGKTEADLWFEQMKADYVKNGAEHLQSARAKMAAPVAPQETDDTTKKDLKG